MRQSTLRVARRQALDSSLVNLRLLSARTFNGFMDSRVTGQSIFVALIFSFAANVWNVRAQEFLPSPPADKARIYILDSQNNVVALHLETGRPPQKITKTAKSSKTSYLEIRGKKAATALPGIPRIFLFTSERQGKPPPFIVWMESRRGVRRATAV